MIPASTRSLLRRQGGTLFCAAALVLILGVYFIEQPLALSSFGIASLGNASLALVLVAIGQTCVLLAGGLDLSIGAIVSLVNCFAATVMGDSVSGIPLTLRPSRRCSSMAALH